MTLYHFDEIIERKDTDCVKYDRLKEHFGREDLIPLWVADMDFRTPDFIIDAMKKRCEHPVFGYTYPSDEYFNSIINWIRELHDWNIRKEWISYIPGIVKGIAFAIEHFTRKGDKVIIQPPIYHPFRLVPDSLGREVVNNPLRLVNGVYEMDFDHLEAIIDEKCKILILSNPHNPAGIVWKKETLQRLASICAGRHIIVISDEIHAEMIYPSYAHHPFPTVSDEAASCSITFAAPSKTFNIAGIVSSYAIVPDDSLRKAFYSFLEAGEFNHGTIFAYTAVVAAYTQGTEWRRRMIDYVIKNVHFVDRYLKNGIPQIKAYMPQASFLVWLDCAGLGLNHKELIGLFRDRANLALNDGAMFGSEGNGYMRLNVGCPRSQLETALGKLKNAI
ncbi:MAG: PatB family C-S lyase [Tannerella sp.]|jgi:cystathionine beta-lyase|nr:PatB family C-S lyase [Tannerella sp.]